jgi:DNA invertase Pin-like site-specific DNA recombinase
MFIGYSRVSKSDGSQVLDLQKDALIESGVQNEHIYEDLASGRFDNRPGLLACLKSLRAGDTLVVWKLDRLGRNLKHLVNIIDDLHKRGVGFRVITGQGANIDTTTPNGKLVFGIFAALAEFERELISERTKAGLKAARARGRKGGRPKKMDLSTLKLVVSAMSDPKTVAADIAKRLGITTATLYKYVNGDGSLKEEGAKVFQLENNSKNIAV